jgi:hypothetical protein
MDSTMGKGEVAALLTEQFQIETSNNGIVRDGAQTEDDMRRNG